MNALVTLPIPDPRRVGSDVIRDMRARATWAASLALGLDDQSRLDVEFVTCRAGWVIAGRFVAVLDMRLDPQQIRDLQARHGGPTHKQYEFANVSTAATAA